MINSISDLRFRGVGVATVLFALLFYFAVLFSFSTAAAPMAVTCTDPILVVASEADFNDAVACYNAESSAGTTVISITADIDLTASTTVINNSTAGAELVINGGNFELDGQDTADVRPIHITNGTVTINELIVTRGNMTGEEDGGGIFNSGVLYLVDSQVTDNEADNGGGIMNEVGGTLSLENVTVSGNIGRDDGGGIQNVQTANPLTVTNSFILGNQSAERSGGIGTLSPTLVDSTVISGNTAILDGGGIFNRSSQLTITNSAILNNSTNQNGGGIFVDSAGVGANTGELMVSNTTLSGNSTAPARAGAAINMASETQGSVENITVVGNESTNGAVALAVTATLTISHATIVSNTAGPGINNAGSVVLINSILANNATADCSGDDPTTPVGTQNLIKDGSCTIGTIASDPNLLPLADNGGFGQTMVPTGAPVTQAATSLCATTDQRGVNRGSTCELGAVEIVEIFIADASGAEGTGGTNAISVIMTRTDASVPMSVTVNTSDDSAIAGDDYTALTNEVVGFDAGQLTKSIDISVTADADIEFDETLDVTISNPVNGVILTSTAVVTITNDDIATIWVADVAVDEGDAGTATMVITATLDTEVIGGLDVDIAVAAGGTATSGDDYTASPATLTFAGTAGETQTYSVVVNGDTDVELDETVIVSLGTITPTNPALSSLIAAGPDGTGTITNDDLAEFTIEAGSTSVMEDVATIPVTVTLSSAATFTATVDTITTDGTATGGSDFVVISDTLAFGIGETVQTFDVTISEDVTDEEDETFELGLSNPFGVNLGTPSSVTISIVDNDDAPTIQLDPSNNYTVNEAAGTLDVIISLSNVSGKPVTATIKSADIADGATAGTDYTAVDTTITIPTDTISQTVSISITDDDVYEEGEQFSIFIESAGNADISTTNAADVVTILDDDGTILYLPIVFR